MSKDYYNILGVDKTANQEEIKKAFHKLAHQHHPDKSGGDEAKFKEINEAYQVLGDTNKRTQYDQFGSTFQNGNSAYGGFNANDFSQGFNINLDDLGDMFGGFGDIFGFNSSRNRASKKGNRGHDLEVLLELPFLEAVFGIEKDLKLKKTVICPHCHGNQAEPGSKIETCSTCQGRGRVNQIQRTIFGQMQVQTTCPTCNGEGKIYTKKCSICHGQGAVKDNIDLRVKIPAGIDNGETIKLSGQGEAGSAGGSAGDLYLKIRVEPHKLFKRDGYNILIKKEISFTQAALGDKIEVETIDGLVDLKIPDGTQSGKVFILRDKGVPQLRSRGRGDQLVEIIIKTPTSLNRRQKELLKELEDLF